MKEADLYGPLVDGANREGWALYRIADGTPGKKPFDIGGAACGGRAVGLEVKVVRTRWCPDQIIPWELFPAHQLAWLRQWARTGGLALVALYRETTRGLSLYRIERAADFLNPADSLLTVELQKEDGLYAGWNLLEAGLIMAPGAPAREG